MDKSHNGRAPFGTAAFGALDVIIVGAGIGGLTAAIGLRQQGHRVRVFEQSRFASETGAAINVAPNCNGLLRRWGLEAEQMQAVEMKGFAMYSINGKATGIDDFDGTMWQHRWLLVHRIHLHSALKDIATSPNGKGDPVELLTSSKVIDADCQEASITLENGDKMLGDFLIGADGVHSKTRTFIPGGHVNPFGSGKSAFRFLIPRKKLLDDPRTATFVERDGQLSMWFGKDRRLVMYPCANNETMNFVLIHPTNESDSSGEEWNMGGNLKQFLEIAKDFGPNEQALFSHIDAANLKVWELLDMEVLPTWVNGRLALLGDAAHPFLPHQGQGGAQAIEDAASIAAVLPFGTPKEEIPERLRLYEKCRYERANRIQEFTRQAGLDRNESSKAGGAGQQMSSYVPYNFGHDEWDHSTQMLRKWQWARNPKLIWRMPRVFGPTPGPRQDYFGRQRDGSNSKNVTRSISFNTSRTLLQNLLPNDAFNFVSPTTVARATWKITTLDEMEWLGGGGYSMAGLDIQGIRYTKKDGSSIIGSYLVVLFENLADPIVSGREELGFPKLFCDIEITEIADCCRARLSWRGAAFADFTWQGLEASAPPSPPNGIPSTDIKTKMHPPVPKEEGILMWRSIPAVGEPGKADVEYATLVPFCAPGVAPPKLESSMTAAKASVSVDPRDWTSLPTLHHVAARLAELPVLGGVEAKVTTSRGVGDVREAFRIE